MNRKNFAIYSFLLVLFFLGSANAYSQSTMVEGVTKWNDVVGPEGLIAFEVAVARGNANEVIDYLKQGANPNFIDRAGYSMINMTASNTGNKTILKLLIDAGVDANVRNNCGWLAIMEAIKNIKADKEFIKMLFDITTDFNEIDMEELESYLNRTDQLQNIIPIADQMKHHKESLSFLKGLISKSTVSSPKK